MEKKKEKEGRGKGRPCLPGGLASETECLTVPEPGGKEDVM